MLQKSTKLIRVLGADWAVGFITYKSYSRQLPYENWQDPIILNNAFYFILSGQTKTYLWRSDGTTIGTSKIKQLDGSFYDYYVMDNLLYLFEDNSLWRSDGTRDGTWKISEAFFSSSNHIIYNNHIFFSAYDDIHHQELWFSDGTSGGTRILKDINVWDDSVCFDIDPDRKSNDSPGYHKYCCSSSFPHDFTLYNNELFFVAYTPVTGFALWKTNGAEVNLVSDFDHAADWDSSDLTIHRILNDRLLLNYSSKEYGNELWTSDGTSLGTVLIKKFLPASRTFNSRPLWLGKSDKITYFMGNDGIHGDELWKTDGTSSGTILLKDITPGPENTIFDDSLCTFPLPELDEEIYFRANIHQFWKSNGTAVGTILMRENFDCGVCGTDFSGIFNNKVYLSASGYKWPNNDNELWVIDGSKAGTKLVAELLPGKHPEWGWKYESYPSFFRVLDDTLLFFAYSSVYHNDGGYLKKRHGLFALTPTEMTLPWLQPLLLNNKEQ